MNKESEERAEEIYLEKELLMPYTYLKKIPSKQMRKKIQLAFNHWLKLPAEKAQFIVDAVEMLHDGSLLLDDIQDNTLLRRSAPAAHLIYGIPLTLNTGIHVMMLVLQKLATLNHPQIFQIFCDDTLEMLRGQGTEVYWRDNFICPTEAQFYKMLKQKTGHMLRLAVQLMQLFSVFKDDLQELSLLLGQYFQLRDDYCNLIKGESVEEWPVENGTNKKVINTINPDNFCEDLTEGKFTLPIIHAANTSDGHVVLHISLKKFCVSELERLGSLQYTRETLWTLDKTLRDEIKRLGGNPLLTSALDQLATY